MANQSSSPSFPGVSRIGFVSLDAITSDMRTRAAAGFPFTLDVDPVWIDADGEARLDRSSQIDGNTREYTSILSFSTRQPVPHSGVAWIAVRPDGSFSIVGWNRYAPGVMSSKTSTSAPGSDPVTVAYEFKSPTDIASLDCC